MHTIEARHKVAAVIREHKADWLFVPYPIDAHPDHVAVTRIGEDARFDAKLTKSDIPGEPWYPKRIIYYFCTHLRMNFTAELLHRHQRHDRAEDRGDRSATSRSSSANSGARAGDGADDHRATSAAASAPAHAEPFFTHEVLGFGGLDQLI